LNVSSSSDALQVSAAVTITAGVTVNIHGILTLPPGTLTSTSIAPFAKVTAVPGKSILTYSAGGFTTTLYVGGFVVGNVFKKAGAVEPGPLLLTDAGQVITTHPDRTQSVHSMHVAPVDLGAASDRVLLVFYAVGVRDASAVQVQIAGQDVPVLYSGASDHFAELDEVTVEVPRSLAGLGDVDVVLTADGQTASPVRIHIQ
jgi:hypothetical protein